MISILVANAKGGCGKTTVATNLATAFANAGLVTALADADRQRSCLGWFKRRPKDAPRIAALDWHKRDGKLPDDIDRLVIDSGAGLRSRHVQDLLKRADIVVMPVLPSVFDERATKAFLKKVEALKPIRKGKKPVAVIGNRLRARTKAETELETFLAKLGHDVAARLRDRSTYQDVARRGLGVFDLSPARRAGVVDDWLPLIHLIEDRG
ncbi:division plane positioning ATPase MipZ [Bauldia sp.]|uniref:nucleotide-binding protein n=1 Tax=Bauldia sp. TaxID=2575872 RepID=UPI003BA8DAC3